MSFVLEQAPASTPVVGDNRFQSVSINVPGRLMCADFSEHDCVAAQMSPGDVQFLCAARPRPNERIVAYLDHLGRVEGRVASLESDGFTIELNATVRKREKLAAQLTWLANKHELGLPEDRRHERYAPRNPRAEISLDDGRRYACRIIDLSLSGAAVEIEVRPALGTPVVLGTMRGRVVRHFQEGIALEFIRIQPAEALRTFL
ncbi:PilZ domain-containing protein [Pararhizobium haloflavum]|uniref:PilZ domain-containing protein n=1 Tax=Pararhizobium haloflavum TaxID=2037914 RepID=UPI000C194193|nr:PilZ domain-containing protein [Pararhizobium haloflavum]